MRRTVVILAVLGVGLWLVVAADEGRGPLATRETRHLRAVKDRAEPPLTYEEKSLESFARLPAKLPLEEFARLEQRGVSVEGYVQRIERSFDGDFHLTVVSQPSTERGRGERYVTAEVTPGWWKGSTSWSFERLVEAFGSDRSGVTAGARHPRRVRISGWLMYDYWYDALPAWTFDRKHRMSGWEVHPVTRIEIWNDVQKTMVELPR